MILGRSSDRCRDGPCSESPHLALTRNCHTHQKARQVPDARPVIAPWSGWSGGDFWPVRGRPRAYSWPLAQHVRLHVHARPRTQNCVPPRERGSGGALAALRARARSSACKRARETGRWLGQQSTPWRPREGRRPERGLEGTLFPRCFRERRERRLRRACSPGGRRTSAMVGRTAGAFVESLLGHSPSEVIAFQTGYSRRHSTHTVIPRTGLSPSGRTLYLRPPTTGCHE